MRQFRTTSEFISSHLKSSGYSSGEIIEMLGYSNPGDEGAALWKATGNTITASQDVIATNDTKISDASGNEFELVATGIIDLNALGGTGGAYVTIATNAGLVWSQSFTSIPSNATLNYDTVSDMVNASGLSVGDVAQTAEHSTGNGGGGTYNYVTVGTTPNVDLPNGDSIIVSTVDATKCFVLRKDSIFNTRQLGAIDESIENLVLVDGDFDGQKLTFSSFWADSKLGGGLFAWDSSTAKSAHNGGTILSPTVPSVANQTGADDAAKLANYHSAAGETDPAGNGVWVRDSNTLWITYFGALEGEANAEVCRESFKGALAYAKSLTSGDNARVPAITNDHWFIDETILVPENCGVEGVQTTASSIKAKSSTSFGGYMFENETKTGVGQEFMYMRKLNLNGNRGGGATCGGILGQQIYINSAFSDLLIQECSDNNICLRATPDLIVKGSGGPVELRNIWSIRTGGNALRIEGDFRDVNVIGGAYEKSDAGSNVVHIDGSLYGGTRAKVSFFNLSTEFSNANVTGLYIKQAVVNVDGFNAEGTQIASQNNIYVDDEQTVSVVTINGVTQSIGTRKGIVFNESGQELNDSNYHGIITSRNVIDISPVYVAGDTGADITFDCNYAKRIIPAGGSATTIANFANSNEEFTLIPSNSNYTVRDNANIVMRSGADTALSSNTPYRFLRVGATFYQD